MAYLTNCKKFGYCVQFKYSTESNDQHTNDQTWWDNQTTHECHHSSDQEILSLAELQDQFNYDTLRSSLEHKYKHKVTDITICDYRLSQTREETA